MRLGHRDPSAEAVARERALIAAARQQAESSRDRAELEGGSGARAGGGAAGLEGAGGDAVTPLRGQLPGYEIQREIHRGGQGVVYLALQRATRRRVAIKVMKEGPFAGPADRHRFKREARILGQINHPSIVTVHDSGTAAGCFYIVMNYIEGLPLDVWIRSADRTLEETLRLFLGICEAVSAAHLRGVIHRDLKPSNIRVDRAGRPHVLDFGLAKVEHGALADQTLLPAMTLTGQFVGSLPWSSPEQAAGDAEGIDVRSDVYSLGVVLYQMLTGVFPYDVGGSMLEVARRIAHAEPIPPSEAVARGPRLQRLFGDRRSERIDDDVETIVLKCLSKDRERRYQNAGELARDIGHYLAGEPIEAKRDSLAYVLGKQVKRHRLAVAFAVTLAFVLLAGFVTSVALWQRAEREAADAVAKGELAEQRAEEARQIAAFQQKMLSDIDPQRMGAHLREDVLAEADAALRRSGAAAEQVGDRLEQVAAQLAGMNLTNVGVRSIDRNVLAPALVAVDRDFADQQLLQAALQESIAKVYLQLGQHEQALPPAQRALETRRRLQDSEHPDTLASMHATALVLYYSFRWAEAEAIAREAHRGRRLVLGDDHVDTMHAASTVILIQFSQNKHEEAEQGWRELLAQRRRVLGDEHPDTLDSINAVAAVLWKTGRLSEVEPYWVELLEKRRRLLGDEDPVTLLSISNMGLLRNSQGRLTEAEGYFREALAGYQSLLGDDHMETRGRKKYLGSVLRRQGRLAEAEPYLSEALEASIRMLGEGASPTRAAELEMARLRHAQGRLSEAEILYRRGLEGTRSALGDDDPATLAATQRLSALLRARGELAEAESLGAELVQRSRSALPPGHRSQGAYLTSHARTLVALGRFEEAESELLEAEAVLAAAPDATSQRRQTIAAIVHLYDAWHAAAPDAGHDMSAGRWRPHLAPGDAGAEAATEGPGGDEVEPQAWGPQELAPRQAISALAAWGSPDAVLASSGDTAAGLFGDLNFTNIGVRSLDRNIIEPALVAIERDFGDQPLIEATLRLSLSGVYRRLGADRKGVALTARALELRQRHLGDDHRDTLDALSELAALHKSLGAYAESERCAREVLEKVRLLLGDDNDRTISAADHLASILAACGKLREAEALNRVSVERRRRLLGDDHLDTLESITGRGFMLWHAGRLAEAEACFLEAIEGRRRLLGNDDSGTLNSIGGLCIVLRSTGRVEEEEPYRRLLVEGGRRNHGDDHPSTLANVTALGVLLRKLGRLEEAERYLSEAVEGSLRSCGPDDLRTVNAMISMALLRREQGRPEEGEQIAAEVLRRVRESGAPPQALRHYLVRHAQMLIALGCIGEAEAELLEVEAMSGPSWPRTQDALNETLLALAHHYDTLHAADPHAGHDARATHWRAGVVEKEAVAGR